MAGIARQDATGNDTASQKTAFSYQYQHSNLINKSSGESKTDTNSMTTGWSVSVPIAPGKSVRATTTWKNVMLDLPFSYELIYSDDSGQEV